MDEIDIRMIMELAINPRSTFRELAATLGMSVNAVYKRFQSLCDQGVLRAFLASPSPLVYGTKMFFLMANYNPIEEDKVLSYLESDDRVIYVYILSGNVIYAIVLLRPGDDVKSVRDHLVQVAGLKDTLCDTINLPAMGSLDGEDHAIIRALHENCRMSLKEVAECTGISMKTVRQRFQKMRNEGLIWTRLSWSPLSSGDHFTFLLITLTDPDLRAGLVNKLLREHMPPIIGIVAPYERSDLILLNLWTHNLIDTHEARRLLSEAGTVSTLQYHVLIDMRENHCWLDRISEGISQP